MFHYKKVAMKCPQYNAARSNNMEKDPAAEAKVHHLKASPVKELVFIKPQCPPSVTTVLFPLNTADPTGAVHGKENSTDKEHERTLEESVEDSGYLSLHNSHNEVYHVDEEDDHIQPRCKESLPSFSASTHQGKSISPKQSPTKCKGRRESSQPVSLASSTPVNCQKRRSLTYSLSSTPAHHADRNLPLLNFERAVCEKLAKNFRKNKRYDWSIIAKEAEDCNLDRVIGRQMGSEFVDMFSSLLIRNMRSILTDILVLLGDMDLISCKKVSKTWRKIICEDSAALRRCERAEEVLRESRSSLSQRACGLTRDAALSRMALSCMQPLSSSSTTPSSSPSSTPGCRVNRRAGVSHKSSTPNSQCTRFEDYVQAASSLKQHESLRHCKLCGSPATHYTESKRAMCTRLSCLFEFCTCCQEAFHSSRPCRVVQPRAHFPSSESTRIIPGSARSKRNIRRL